MAGVAAQGESQTAETRCTAGWRVERPGARFVYAPQGTQRTAHGRGVGDTEKIAKLEVGNSTERKDLLPWRRRGVPQLRVGLGGAEYGR